MTLIVTTKGQEVADKIDEYSGRDHTAERQGKLFRHRKRGCQCACSNKQMYAIRKMVKEVDPSAFTVIMESNEVVGEGFKEALNPHVKIPQIQNNTSLCVHFICIYFYQLKCDFCSSVHPFGGDMLIGP